MYHDSVSMIVSRFISFVEDFVICCYEVTKFLCPRYWFASSPSAKSPCNVGPLAYFAISVFREMSINTVLLGSHFQRIFRISVMRHVGGCWHFYIFEIICELLQPLGEVSQALPLGSPLKKKTFLFCGFEGFEPVSRYLFITS